MRRTVRKIGPLAWRVRAFDGEHLEFGASRPLVSEISGEITLERSRSTRGNKAQRCLLAVVVHL
jgi:hypothetical protein